MLNPRPVPPYLRVVEESTWVKLSKIPWSLSAGMPMPVSETEKRNAPDAARSGSIRSATSPRSVNLIALPSKFTSTWRKRVGSPVTQAGTSGWTNATNSSCLALARMAINSAVLSTRS